MRKSFTISFSVPWATFWAVVLPLLLLACAGGLLCGILLVDRLIMPHVVGVNKGTIAVPAVTGMPLEAARDRLLEVGLRWEVASREYSDDVASGCVISQLPAAGADVKKGRLVGIVVSRGPKNGPVPDVRDLNDRQARIELRRAGFDVGRIKKAYHDTVVKDLAISTMPEKGTIISREMSVDLIMSMGPKPTHAEVPNIVGESIESAREKIEESGLVVGTMDYANNLQVPPGTVMSQSLSPGARAPLESRINLVVSVQRR